MKKLFISFLILLPFLSFSQIRGITETGDEVLLFQDGTWTYVNDSSATIEEIKLNETIFEKSSSLTFLVKSTKLNIGIWIDPKVWGFSKNSDVEAAEFQFQKKGEDLYGMLISEKIQIEIESLKEIALINARSAAPDVKVIHEEYRMVNGTKVLMMQMAGTIQGIKFIYYGYYYSNANGTIQFLTYTSNDLLPAYLSDIELFLNGLVEL
jgi:hypothetical protein